MAQRPTVGSADVGGPVAGAVGLTGDAGDGEGTAASDCARNVATACFSAAVSCAPCGAITPVGESAARMAGTDRARSDSRDGACVASVASWQVAQRSA